MVNLKLKLFVVAIFLGNVLGGGDTQCGALEGSFTDLLQVAQHLIDNTFTFIKGIVQSYPAIGLSYINYFTCKLNVSKSIVATASSKLSKVPSDYVLKIFDGMIESSFIAPLNCIEFELLSFREYLSDLINDAISLKSLVQKSPITGTIQCSEALNFTAPFFLVGTDIAKNFANQTADELNAFTSIDQKEAFTQYFNEIGMCGLQSMVDIIAGLTNMDENIITAWVLNKSIPVPPPLSCFGDRGAANVENGKAIIISLNDTTNNPNVPNSCDPYTNNFSKFANIWRNYTSRMQEVMSNMGLIHPVLIPAFINGFSCELNSMVNFAANFASNLTHVNISVILEILIGNTPRFDFPLNCISTDLIGIKNFIWNAKKIVIPELESLTRNSTSNRTSCASTYDSLVPYTRILVEWQNLKLPFVKDAATKFEDLNVTDPFLDSFIPIAECVPNVLGDFIGAALNLSSNVITEYLKCNTLPLNYPLSCVKVLIDIMQSWMDESSYNVVTKTFHEFEVMRLPLI